MSANMKGAMVPGSVRNGGGVLAGLLRCGHCGRKLKVQHNGLRGVARYVCNDADVNHATRSKCIAFGNMREGERAERRELILHEAATRLGVSKMTVIRLIRDGLLPARQVCVGAPYVIQVDLDQPSVRRAIENGRAVSPDARQESMSFQ